MAERQAAEESDEELIRRYRAGDADAVEVLLEKYKPLVQNRARAMYLLGGENDDLIQEGMIGLVKAVRDFRPEEDTSFASFAALCVSRQIYTAVEAAQRGKHAPLNSYVSLYREKDGENGDGAQGIALIDTIESDEENDPEALYFSRESARLKLETLKKTLSPMEKKVLDLYLDGADYRDIAWRMGKTPKSIDNALQRIRGKAQKLKE